MSDKRKLKKALKRWVDLIDDDNDLLDKVTRIELKHGEKVVADATIAFSNDGPTCDPIVGCTPPDPETN